MKEISYFREDVKVVVQALERQKIDDLQGKGLPEIQRDKREAVRLAVALRGFFLDGGVSQEQRDEFGCCIQDGTLCIRTVQKRKSYGIYKQ